MITSLDPFKRLDASKVCNTITSVCTSWGNMSVQIETYMQPVYHSNLSIFFYFFIVTFFFDKFRRKWRHFRYNARNPVTKLLLNCRSQGAYVYSFFVASEKHDRSGTMRTWDIPMHITHTHLAHCIAPWLRHK